MASPCDPRLFGQGEETPAGPCKKRMALRYRDGALYGLLLVAAERKDIILRSSGSHVAPSMFLATRDVSDRAGFQGHAVPHDGDFESALMENNHFFVHMMVRRMRCLTRSKFGHVQLDRDAGVGRAVEDRS